MLREHPCACHALRSLPRQSHTHSLLVFDITRSADGTRYEPPQETLSSRGDAHGLSEEKFEDDVFLVSPLAKRTKILSCGDHLQPRR